MCPKKVDLSSQAKNTISFISSSSQIQRYNHTNCLDCNMGGVGIFFSAYSLLNKGLKTSMTSSNSASPSDHFYCHFINARTLRATGDHQTQIRNALNDNPELLSRAKIFAWNTHYTQRFNLSPAIKDIIDLFFNKKYFVVWSVFSKKKSCHSDWDSWRIFTK